jgi:hypothetical protein
VPLYRGDGGKNVQSWLSSKLESSLYVIEENKNTANFYKEKVFVTKKKQSDLFILSLVLFFEFKLVNL